jgi:hypothetical protein
MANTSGHSSFRICTFTIKHSLFAGSVSDLHESKHQVGVSSFLFCGVDIREGKKKKRGGGWAIN